VEDYGNKWSMSGLLRHLQREGVNVAELMMRIEDVVVKTILCSEEQIASSCKLVMPHRGTCFGELLYSGKFSWGPIFAVFADEWLSAKIRPT
jgi:hypothetical protein